MVGAEQQNLSKLFQVRERGTWENDGGDEYNQGIL
jgi:hypothetical protein